MSQPTLAIDFSVLENRPFTGVERYALALWNHLPDALEGWRLLAFSRRDHPLECADGRGGWQVEVLPSALPRAWWRRQTLPDAVRDQGADLFFSPVAHVPQIPGVTSCRTIHDIPAGEAAKLESKSFWRSIQDMRVLNLDVATIVPSKATADVLLDYCDSITTPVQVIHHGLDASLLKASIPQSAPDSRTILVIGTVRPRRMPHVLQAALEMLRRKEPHARVRWIGRLDMDVAEFLDIEFLGSVSDEEKLKELKGASCIVCPSLVEGFGFPILEGLACGLPVISADHATSREVGGEQVTFYDGTSEVSLAAAIRQVWENQAGEDEALRITRHNHAASFTWQESARQHAAFFRALLK